MVGSQGTAQPSATEVAIAINRVGMDLCLSLITIPVLTSFVVGSATLQLLQQLGEFAESGLHRDRLPTLNLPEAG